MVHIGDGIAAQIASASGRGVPAGANISLRKDLPPNLQNKIIQGKVEGQNQDGSFRIAIKSGEFIDAEISPPPKIGSQITFVQLKNGETKLTQMVVDAFKNPQEINNDQPLTKENPQQSQQGSHNQANSKQNNLHSGGEKQNFSNSGSSNNPDSKTYQQQVAAKSHKPQVTTQNLNQTAAKVSQAHHTDPYASLRPLVGQTIMVKGHDGKVLPAAQNILTVVVSKSENGLQTLQPQNMNMTTKPLPSFRAQLPIEVPEKTILKLDISPNNQAKILEITPPKVANHTTSIQTKKDEAQAPKLSNSQTQNIILTTKIDTPIKPLPTHSFIDVQTLGKAENLPPMTQKITQPNGQTIEQQIPQFRVIAKSSGGQVFTLTTQTDIPEGVPLRLNNSAGDFSVQKVLERPLPNTQMVQNTPQSLKPNVPTQVSVTSNPSPQAARVLLPTGEQINIQTPHSIPIGTQINIMLKDDGMVELLPSSLTVNNLKTMTLTELANSWNTLNKAIQTLQQNQPVGADQLQNNIPNLSKDSFLPNILAFIDAVNNQTLSRLTGDETMNLLKALGVDFSADLMGLQNASQKSNDSPDTWRGLLFPYIEADEKEPKQGGFFWHSTEDEEGIKHGTRFIAHLELTALGETQLNGFVKEKEIQLKLASEKPLEEEHKIELKSIVLQILENFGWTGNIEISTASKKLEKPINLMIDNLNKQMSNI